MDAKLEKLIERLRADRKRYDEMPPSIYRDVRLDYIGELLMFLADEVPTMPPKHPKGVGDAPTLMQTKGKASPPPTPKDVFDEETHRFDDKEVKKKREDAPTVPDRRKRVRW
jgi:hypothetical protein